jgi:DNA-binding NarL/FixJ family response regulator
MKPRVFIWYGHHLFAKVMEPVLRREGMEIVGVATLAEEAVPAVLAAHPDVVVTDRIVEREHPLGIAEIIRGSARVRVLVLDLIEDEMRIYDGLGQGAAKLTSIIRAIEDAVERPALPLAG